MDVRKIAVVVEDAEAARTALGWALRNLLRCGDVITLIHVYSAGGGSRSRKKLRLLRLRGYQLALSFKDICSGFPNTNIEIVVAEGDQEGAKIASLVREMGASALVVGLHDRSFLYKLTFFKAVAWRSTECGCGGCEMRHLLAGLAVSEV